MKPTVCQCCGQRFQESLKENPNICVACATMEPEEEMPTPQDFLLSTPIPFCSECRTLAPCEHLIQETLDDINAGRRAAHAVPHLTYV